MERLIYMDNAATTRLCDAAVSAMIPFLQEEYANPSGNYEFAYKVRRAVEKARKDIAMLINAREDERYFNSGGTEGDNQALRTFVSVINGKFAVSKIEHHAVLNTCDDISRWGGKVQYIDVDKEGIVNLDYIKNIIDDTDLISVMAANNEIGTIEPIKEIGKIKKEKNTLFHVDAVQAFGHIPIDVNELNIDILTASAHKFGGPKGVGFMYVRRGKVFKPFITGGSQERGKRGGTHNTTGIVAMAAAARQNVENMSKYKEYEIKLRDIMISRLLSEIPDSRLNGSGLNRLPGNVNISFKGIDGQALLMFLDDNNICASTASACSASDNKISHVLEAIDVPGDYTAGTIRLTLNHENNIYQVMKVCEVIKAGVLMLRNLSS